MLVGLLGMLLNISAAAVDEGFPCHCCPTFIHRCKTVVSEEGVGTSDCSRISLQETWLLGHLAVIYLVVLCLSNYQDCFV